MMNFVLRIQIENLATLRRRRSLRLAGVHHAVERQAMTKYYKNLGLTDAELNSLESLRGIPTDINYDIHLRKIRKRWDDFYEANPDGPNMTKQKLLDYAKEIDDEFGHLFLPPVR